MNPLLLSLLFASAGTLLASAVAIPVAALIADRRARLRLPFEVLLTLPLVVPPTALGYLLLRLLGSNGPVAELTGLHLLFTPGAAVVAAALAGFPLLFRGALAAFDAQPAAVAQAAAVSGQSPLTIWWHIRLPMASAGLVAALALAFARSMGEFGITMMVAGAIPGRTETASLAIYAANAAGHTAEADALVAAVLAISGLLLTLISLRRAGH